MKIKTPVSIASVLLVGVFATGCSQQQQQADAGASSSQAQNADACKDNCKQTAPVVQKPVVRPPVKRPMGKNCHNHPENADRGTVNHCHPNEGPHSHRYGQGSAKPQIDVAELQRRLKAKGYYKGPIDGNLSVETKDALSAYQSKN
ncbi:MAG: peptidoglycan-binding domain-containing protein [bacterium]